MTRGLIQLILSASARRLTRAVDLRILIGGETEQGILFVKEFYFVML
jgi:hypothetical protein